jgi:predicted TIM-barrel fold metal-dependent hydrolase
VVDAHVHVWRATRGPDLAQTIVPPSADVPVTVLTRHMDEHGVDRGVLVQPICAGADNAYVADAAAAEPDRLAAVCVVDPASADAPEDLAHWVTERGCAGVRLRPAAAEGAAWLDARDADALWARAQELGVVVSLLMHAGHVPAVDRVAARFEDVAIVLDHFGRAPGDGLPDPDDERALLALARRPNVHVKVSGYHHLSATGYPYRDCWPLFARVAEAYGADRLLWGSDFPHVLLACGYAGSVRLQERFHDELSPAELAAVMGGTAGRLYWRRDIARTG